jgi:cytochrome P450
MQTNPELQSTAEQKVPHDISETTPLIYPMKRGWPLDLPAEYTHLRKESPVARARLAFDGTEVWIVTGYREACSILEDPRCSADGVRPGFPRPMTMKPPPPGTFIRMDPPDHTRLRIAIAAEFKPDRIAKLRPAVQGIVDKLLDDITAQPPPIDLVDKFALPLPSMVICELVGVPYADRSFFHERIRVIGLQGASRARHGEVREELEAHLFTLAALREKEPADDLLSRLITRHREVGDITREEAVGIATLLLIAGYETLANMIGLGTVVLLENHDRFDELRRDPAKLAVTIEELLRYQTVTMFGIRRVATEDLEIGGTSIRAGDGIIVLVDSANRDETEFPEGDRFNMHREINHHLAFGHGIHACIGQPLARLELEIAWATILRRVPTLQLAVPLAEIPFKHDTFIYGVHKLPVKW